MKQISYLSLCLILPVVAAVGCRKKADSGSEEKVVTEASSPKSSTTEPTSNGVPGRTFTYNAATMVPEEPTVEDANRALKRKDYETAAVDLLKMQYSQKPMTDDQAWARKRAMADLQRELGEALAKGDPKAKAAAELLRSSAAGVR